jgi:hypothetical protein
MLVEGSRSSSDGISNIKFFDLFSGNEKVSFSRLGAIYYNFDEFAEKLYIKTEWGELFTIDLSTGSESKLEFRHNSENVYVASNRLFKLVSPTLGSRKLDLVSLPSGLKLASLDRSRLSFLNEYDSILVGDRFLLFYEHNSNLLLKMIDLKGRSVLFEAKKRSHVTSTVNRESKTMAIVDNENLKFSLFDFSLGTFSYAQNIQMPMIAISLVNPKKLKFISHEGYGELTLGNVTNDLQIEVECKVRPQLSREGNYLLCADIDVLKWWTIRP